MTWVGFEPTTFALQGRSVATMPKPLASKDPTAAAAAHDLGSAHNSPVHPTASTNKQPSISMVSSLLGHTDYQHGDLEQEGGEMSHIYQEAGNHANLQLDANAERDELLDAQVKTEYQPSQHSNGTGDGDSMEYDAAYDAMVGLPTGVMEVIDLRSDDESDDDLTVEDGNDDNGAFPPLFTRLVLGIRPEIAR
ncbi:hypothetical protein BCR44DRAFT_336453 [Catenaria anguillulae PL171]|uniref:Uncharacterized protein n=1 Tax=Catenaria anguillulae PL171 TaxID=765915 RepID=A0A1Y2H3X3_9FUNG|nr:hypothetical protein BCR44DRAFT_336453 [Catenaria anguillulae PL171]